VKTPDWIRKGRAVQIEPDFPEYNHCNSYYIGWIIHIHYLRKSVTLDLRPRGVIGLNPELVHTSRYLTISWSLVRRVYPRIEYYQNPANWHSPWLDTFDLSLRCANCGRTPCLGLIAYPSTPNPFVLEYQESSYQNTS
jgi:hypothetical protein